ncbi:MAG TPA: iron-sulfur cluster assembly accessory protein [Candidatus Binataceae bacterium]|jgi:iron-sulfur cluster assembly accessory protein|nr:iron-sulfur cluster assembly accessory protein [Candidatus Binataceae bacterium]
MAEEHQEAVHQEVENVTINPAGELPGVNLTPKAIEKVKQMLAKEGSSPDFGLRVGVTGGGCSGFQYSLSFDGCKEDDVVKEFDGLKVYIDTISLPYIAGTTLDYVEGLHNAGFRFDNPRASRTCGCGSSFSA